MKKTNKWWIIGFIAIALVIVIVVLLLLNTVSKTTYKIDFIDNEGTVIKSVDVEKGKNAIPPEAPFLKDHTFSKWSEEIINIQSDKEIKPEYDEVDTPTIVAYPVYIGKNTKEFTMSVYVMGNTGFSSLMFDVNYDETLKLKNVSLGMEFGSYITTPEPYDNPQTISVISPLKDITTNGKIAEFTFSINADMNGEELISKHLPIKINAENTVDQDFEAVKFITIDGVVNIINE